MALDNIHAWRLFEMHGGSSALAEAGTNASAAKIAIHRMALSSHDIERHGLNDIVMITRRVLDQLIGLRLADPIGGAGGEG